MQNLGLTVTSGFDRHHGSDGVTIARFSPQTECDRRADILHGVAQEAKLRSCAIFENNFQAAVVVNIRQSKRTTVIKKIQPNHSGNFGKCAVAIVDKEDVPLETIPS